MTKVKNWLYTVLATLTVCVMGIIPAFAADSASAIETALTTAFGEMKDDVLGVIVAALPIGLIIFGSMYSIRKGKQAFNSISK